MKYMIHACPSREWFVYGYMIPEMTRQGIEPSDIEIWMDRNGDGNLLSCMKAFLKCGENEDEENDGTWHLQDDVILSGDFAKKTLRYDRGIVCGFGRKGWQQLPPESGTVPAVYMWNSFPCIRIPDRIAAECAEWTLKDAIYRETYHEYAALGKCDDSFWYDFLVEVHGDMRVTNLDPNIVEHADFLIGGSVLHKRDEEVRSSWWRDQEAFDRAVEKINELKAGMRS